VQLADAIVLRYGVKGDVATFAVQAQLPPQAAYLGIGLSELGSIKGAGAQQHAQHVAPKFDSAALHAHCICAFCNGLTWTALLELRSDSAS
jgi:hypothetical protein